MSTSTPSRTANRGGFVFALVLGALFVVFLAVLLALGDFMDVGRRGLPVGPVCVLGIVASVFLAVRAWRTPRRPGRS